MSERLQKRQEQAKKLEAQLQDQCYHQFFNDLLEDMRDKRNVSECARGLGLSREGLYKSLGPEGKPRFATIHALLKANGFEMKIEAIK